MLCTLAKKTLARCDYRKFDENGISRCHGRDAFEGHCVYRKSEEEEPPPLKSVTTPEK
jgi:hypothetical protein